MEHNGTLSPSHRKRGTGRSKEEFHQKEEELETGKVVHVAADFLKSFNLIVCGDNNNDVWKPKKLCCILHILCMA